MNILDLFRRCIVANELDNNLAFVYRFSDPDGVRSGKSGWSFGICQFDINNNPSAVLCLRECGFTTDETAALKAQTIDVKPLAARLKKQSATVDRWDSVQLHECLLHPLQICSDSGVAFADDEAKLHLADYHNQFYMSRGGKMHGFLCGLGRPVSASDILACKLRMPWGRKRPDDVRRRYNNIVRIAREAA